MARSGSMPPATVKKKFEHPRSHAIEHLPQPFPVAHPDGFQIVRMLTRMQEQADARRVHGITHDVSEPTDACRHASPGRQV